MPTGRVFIYGVCFSGLFVFLQRNEFPAGGAEPVRTRRGRGGDAWLVSAVDAISPGLFCDKTVSSAGVVCLQSTPLIRPVLGHG